MDGSRQVVQAHALDRYFPLTLEKEAVTVLALSIVNWHVDVVPLQAPPHPLNLDPVAVAVSVTTPLKAAEHTEPHCMPAGLLTTVPLPDPRLVTVKGKDRVKVAVTVVSAAKAKEHGPCPVHPPPLHPEKVEPAAGVGVSVTSVPAG